MVERISSLDDGYESGDLSVFPEAIDSSDELYEVKNNAETSLKQSLTYNGDYLIVEDTSAFPDKGLLRVGEEIVYYTEKATGIFKGLKRGYAGSQQNSWPIGAWVANSVMAETHNAVKDAILNIENYVGIDKGPAEDSFNFILQALEVKHLSPKALFRSYPRAGRTPLTVRFQNFSNREAVRFLWDFGDGGTSTDLHPTHTYVTEGEFTVQLRIVTSLGGQGVTTKRDYVTINDDKGIGFMYVTPEMGSTATTFEFVDQTEGDIILRHWNFGDGIRISQEDPDIHTITHTYAQAGSYTPTLLVIYADQRLNSVILPSPIIVT